MENSAVRAYKLGDDLLLFFFFSSLGGGMFKRQSLDEMEPHRRRRGTLSD